MARLMNLPNCGGGSGARLRRMIRRRSLRLPAGLADFSRRGFRVNRPFERAALERHAGAFLVGFNLAAENWPRPHEALSELADEERGFGYEGAGMYAGLRDLLTGGRSKALERLIAGPGDEYIHLAHVGVGWVSGSIRSLLPLRLPTTPLLRWLALDGAGFAEAYFGGERAVRRHARHAPRRGHDLWWASRLAGCGRALWFIQSADVSGVNAVIAGVHPLARPHLWNGIGLACAYAGCVDVRGIALLAEASRDYRSYLAQGVVFAANARVRSGVVPDHTALVCRQLLAVDVDVAARWADTAALGLERALNIDAYGEWKARIQRIVDER